MSVCYVVGAGEWSGPSFVPGAGDLVLAADGGLTHLRRRGIRVDAFVGDGDSLMGEVPAGCERIALPRQKNDTDMLAALRLGCERGYRRFALYGGCGGRLDHTLANLQCLAWLARRGAQGLLYGDGVVLTAIRNGTFCPPAAPGATVSVFAWGGPARGVTLSGLQYPLRQAVLTPDFPLGVSNVQGAEKSSITVEDGVLLICYEGSSSIWGENSSQLSR